MTRTASWRGTSVEILRISDGWITVKFLEKCRWFSKGERVCVSRYNIIERTPLYRSPIKIHRTPVQ